MLFLFLHKKHICGYSDVSSRGTSNEYPQHMFLCIIRKISILFD